MLLEFCLGRTCKGGRIRGGFFTLCFAIFFRRIFIWIHPENQRSYSEGSRSLSGSGGLEVSCFQMIVCCVYTVFIAWVQWLIALVFEHSYPQGSVEEWPISQEGWMTEVVGELAPQQGRKKVCGLAWLPEVVSCPGKSEKSSCGQCYYNIWLGGGFKYFLCSPLPQEDFQFD